MRRRMIAGTILILAVLLWAVSAPSYASPPVCRAGSGPALSFLQGQGGGLSAPVQFAAGGHVLGFGRDSMYLAAPDHTVKVEFVGGSGVPARTASGGAVSHRVVYKGLWEGIDLAYESADGGIAESTYYIAPGADPGLIRLRYNHDPEMQGDGSLRFAFSGGFLTESAPVAWQEIGGRRMPVTVAFAISDGEVGFRLGAYDRSHALTIDPTYVWHTFYGSGNGLNSGYSIALDGAGNIYIAGESDATWTGPSGERALHDFSAASNIFVLKLNSSGAYQWHTFFGAGNTFGFGIAVDPSGNIFVTGNSSATWNGPLGQAPLHAFAGSVSDIVVLKLDTNGTYQWHTFFGESRFNSGFGVAADGSGNIFVAGESDASWNGPGSQPPQHSFSGNGANIFVLKLNATGGGYLQHTFFGSTGNSSAYSVSLDGSGNVVVAGNSDADWSGPAAQAPLNAFSGSSSDIVVLKLDSLLAYQWHTFYGGTAFGFSVALDGPGNVYVTGETDASWNGPLGQAPLNGYSGGLSGIADIVVLKLDPAGQYQWHTFYGGSGFGGFGNGISVTADTNVYVAGPTNVTWNGPAGQLPVEPYAGITGTSNAFVLKLDNLGAYQWHTFQGANGLANAVAASLSGNIHITGESTVSWNGPLGQTALNAFNGTVSDIFVLKLYLATPPTVTTTAISGIMASTAVSGGAVTADGGAAVTARGVCWSGSVNPTIADTCTVNGTGTGSFISLLSGLTVNTPYHVRAYATNAAGTSYGGDLQFTTLSQLTLTVTLAGTGSGTVTADTGVLNWSGPVGTALYNPGGPLVTLTASPAPGSVFTAWVGACAGNGLTCQLGMTADRTTTATFTSNADFSGTPVAGSLPLTVAFADASAHGPTSWLWDFGDGSSSTLQNPSHTYTSAGNYTVALTATGTGGPSTMTKSNYISVGPCGNLPVNISGTAFFNASVQNTYNTAFSGDAVLIQAVSFAGGLSLQHDIVVALRGGYSCDFSIDPGFTTITGPVTVDLGTVTMDRIIIR